jgi:MarR-like DNA-binding transcriptional regulator SgrR of sgrS sRNA
MRLFDWRWLVISNALGLAFTANAETRPQYGGTLHVAVRAAPASLDPADQAQPDSFARRSLTMLLFDTLVTLDDNGRVQASLATSWQASGGDRRWQFRLRRGIKFHDGTPLTAEIAAESLGSANPTWKVSADGDSVVIERDGAAAELLAELALTRNAIAKRDADGKLGGTGPFRIIDWQPGKRLSLAADENCWKGRPFLDGVEVEMGLSFRDQMLVLQAGKADLIEVAAEQLHRVALEGWRVASSLPIELLALVFTREVQSSDDKALREALALSVERGSIRSVLLQGVGEPAASILPNWMSGYGFVFPADAALTRARHAREQVRTIPTWTVAYESSDPEARLLSERIALNARDAGLSLMPTTAAVADLRLVRIPLSSSEPWIALADVAALLGMPVAKNKGDSVEDLYAAERTLLATQRLIPLFHLPASYVAEPTLRNWNPRSDGSLSLSDAWLGSGKP